jgi:parvulin-like peptidyl-prolyl isomerase
MKRNIKVQKRVAALVILLGTSLLAGCSAGSAQSASDISGGTVTPSPEINLTIGGTATPSPEINLTIGSTVTPSPEINLTIGGTSTPVIVNTLPTSTPTPDIPTATPRPTLAARVNGHDITLEQFNAELARYIAADPASPDPSSPEGMQLATQLKDSVLETLIDQTLVEQEAERNKVSVTDHQVDDEINSLIQTRGGQDKFDAWLAANKQSEQDVRDAVRHELLATAMRDRIVAQLPHTAEYVHAYHIVVATEAAAQSVLNKLKSGARFTALAQQLSIDDSTRPDGGDLGWFARGTGSILWPEVEDAAFALKPGQVSPIVHSPIGYHIIKVVDRQTRALTPDDLASLEQQALEQWITSLRAKATIVKFI